jgi:adenylate kinase
MAAVATLARRTAALHTAAAEPGSKAFAPSELPAVCDLFATFADPDTRTLDRAGLAAVLDSIGERPGESTLSRLFAEADTDESGTIDLAEFLTASDSILGGSPARSIWVVGGPGSGKGLLCSRLVSECGVSHVSCGDMLREEVVRGTPLGRQVAEIMQRGELVSSRTIIALLRRRMREFPGRRLLLDGFPRSRQNAVDFADHCGHPELALVLVCPEATMVDRILARAETEGRADDNIDTALARIETFRAQGEPTLAWLREHKVPIVPSPPNHSP